MPYTSRDGTRTEQYSPTNSPVRSVRLPPGLPVLSKVLMSPSVAASVIRRKGTGAGMTQAWAPSVAANRQETVGDDKNRTTDALGVIRSSRDFYYE